MPATQFGKVIQHIHNMAAGGLAPGRTDRELLDRFVATQDEEAFAALVTRHGPMVFRVCRRVLEHEQDAEDAFQAVFLVLARNASSIRKREALAEWLHGVAYRTSMKAKRTAARRRNHEATLQSQARAQGAVPSWSDVQIVLDEEIQRLPKSFRAAFVVCVLEGKTGRQAASELGIPAGTVSSRLTWARKRLQLRLSSRGIELSALLVALSVAESAGKAMPARLVSAKLLTGLIASATGPIAGSISSHVAALAREVSRAMFLSKAKIVTGMVIAACLATVTAHQVLSASRTERPSQESSVLPKVSQIKPKEKPEADKVNAAQDSITCNGRVLDPDGKPFPGAKLYLNDPGPKEEQRPLRAISGPDGRFSFTFKRPVPDPAPRYEPWFQIFAVAEGFGPGWANEPPPLENLTLRLVRDMPIQGRIVDLEGKPVRGATLRIEHIDAYTDTEAFLQSVRDREWYIGETNRWWGPFPGQPQTLTTGAEGRFSVTGVGRDRVIKFHLEGPGIQFGEVRALVREMVAPVQPRPLEYGPVITKVYGATFDHAALPSRLIRGVVRDKKTGLPIAGVGIRADGTTFQMHSDSEGRYQLLGCPKNAKGYPVSFTPLGLLYFSNSVTFPDRPGLDPIQGDIELIGGILAKGRVTNAATGKLIAGARVAYNPLYPNPNVRVFGSNGSGAHPCSWAEIGTDGSYSLVVLPGPGALGFYANSSTEVFMPALVTTQELKDFFKDNEDHGDESRLRIQVGVNGFNFSVQEQFNQLLLINPSEKDESLTRDMALRPARPLRGRVVGSDGKPLAGVTAYRLAPQVISQPLKDDSFTVRGLNPRRTHQLVFVDKLRKQAAFVSVSGETKEPLIVRLENCGSAVGRLLDAEGQPVANAIVRLDTDEVSDSAPARVKTDSAGRFRFNGIVPGQKHQARLGLPYAGQYLFKPFTLAAGENKDLGDVIVKSN